MTGPLLAGCGLTVLLAVGCALLRARAGWVTAGWVTALCLAVAGGWPAVALFGPWAAGSHGPAPAARLAAGLGTLVLTRVGAGVLAAPAVAAALRQLGRGPGAGRGSAAVVAVTVAPLAILALSARGLVPLALLLVLVPLAVAARWQVAGAPGARPGLAMRSVAITAVGLLAGAALAPTVGITRTVPAVVGIVVAVALAAAIGLVPFTPWAVLAGERAPADVDLGLTWCVPIGVLGAATLLAGLPRGAASSLQTLLIGLGLATAVVWALIAAAGSDRTRVAAVQAADVGLMVVGIASGRVDGLVGALLLLLVVLVVPPALATGAPLAARVAGCLAVGGLPPLGAFPARLLVLAAVAAVASAPTWLVTLAMGGLLVAGARGALAGLGGARHARGRDVPAPREARAAAGPGWLAAGPGWLAAGAALLTGPLGPLLVPLVYGVRW